MKQPHPVSDRPRSSSAAGWRTPRALLCALLCVPFLLAGCAGMPGARPWTALFPNDGPPASWTVRAWNDVSKPAEGSPVWKVEGGVLRGGEPRGSWLMSEREYGDFDLEFDFRLGERGNSGCALRVPLRGDPAFDGVELQMADFRYNPEAKDSELTGGFYRALAPTRQVYQPTAWNHYAIRCRGSKIRVHLNGVLIQDADLAGETTVVKRHDGTDAVPLKDRPRRGHIGFQELSRDGSHVEIRNAFIREYLP